MNQDIVNRIKDLCRAQNTSLTKLEVEFAWGNGTIGKWAKSKKAPPVDRLQMIAERLSVTVNYLLTGQDENKPAPVVGNELDIQKLVNSMDREQLVDFIMAASARLRDME